MAGGVGVGGSLTGPGFTGMEADENSAARVIGPEVVLLTGKGPGGPFFFGAVDSFDSLTCSSSRSSTFLFVSDGMRRPGRLFTGSMGIDEEGLALSSLFGAPFSGAPSLPWLLATWV
jgi:hypothetical protein